MIENFKSKTIGLLTFGKLSENFLNQLDRFASKIIIKNLSLEQNMNEAATHLFEYLRALDRQQPDIILAQKVPDQGLGIAINDRLKKASQKSTLS